MFEENCPDGLCDVILAKVCAGTPNWMLDLLNKCHISGSFPGKWKIARLVLLKKKDQDGTDPSLYRPLCLLNKIGKLMERIIMYRMSEDMNRDELFQFGGLHRRQYGFRVNCTTIDAIKQLKDVVAYKKESMDCVSRLASI